MNPPLCIVLFTYAATPESPRVNYAETTMRQLLDKLLPYEGELRFHIADDGSFEGYTDHLREIAGGYRQLVSVGSSNAQRGGYGASYNLAMQTVHQSSELVLAIEDDWVLGRHLDLNPLVAAIKESASTPKPIRSIRMGYLGFTQPLYGSVISAAGSVYLWLSPTSPEPHVFAGHPRLETVAYERDIGPWPEGIDAGSTEFEVAHREASRFGVAWPMDLALARGDLFGHIGTVQARSDQLATA